MNQQQNVKQVNMGNLHMNYHLKKRTDLKKKTVFLKLQKVNAITSTQLKKIPSVASSIRKTKCRQKKKKQILLLYFLCHILVFFTFPQ
jgi:hypothetical protein